ncbi:hypothetical protein ILP92_05510 [Maribius pontilimi]|uniref:Uncharacterized protein n=1 Tax=Palleronia pontilimi TaxID=1964209 RepID=A0A934MGA1_9RHOB|nr:hypothetical protein [Palleronia pontilimi]MBJ3762199.1 hypothetical protein [Palleronia pontilimi]
MRNYTGLALVFPLQIRTDPGPDLSITLRDPATDQPALTARLRAGQFFRVLVPAGTYTLDVTADTPTPSAFTYPEPLNFQIVGLGRKMGYLIDLRGDGPPTDRPIGLCQTFDYDIHDLEALRDYYRLPLGDPDRPEWPPSRETRDRFCD